MDKPPFYVVTNGRLVLHLEPAEEGGYVVTSPFDPALITEAETIEEAFEMAEDEVKTLAEGQAQIVALMARRSPRCSPRRGARK
jgi:antitoxin HicB